MSISPATRNKIREKADFSCEYCGISETDSGGELTVDHFQPASKGGDDEENLVYCCFRCNLYKGDYWSDAPNQTRLWNPRKDKRDEHFWLSETGRLLALTKIGEFAIKLLRLNRPPLAAKRQKDYQQIEEHQILEQLQKAVETLVRLNQQQQELLKEQRNLLEEQRRLLKLLFRE